ncbi:MAG: low molecular weight protein arginine phosphatase [Vulcanimicrobiota bacterium]
MSKVLMVCTGNTCRSPLAQVIMQKLHPEWEVLSAGVAAEVGAPAAAHSRQLAREMGLSLEQHRAQSVTPELVAWADEILCMTSSHLNLLNQAFPEARNKARTLGREIADPYGQSLSVYQRCAEQIEAALVN